MTRKHLHFSRLYRRLATGNSESLWFQPGVNVLVGSPNTGKTKWLQTLDFILGDSGSNPYESTDTEGLSEKYDAAGVLLHIGDEIFEIERRWKEAGAKGKVYVDGTAMLAADFQHWLMKRLGIPVVNFPKGNPMSGQTWPELSFRTLLRHIYRQQRFWGGLVDQQSEAEIHACLLLFLGLADDVFSKDYGELVRLRLESMRLSARREHYGQTLNDLASGLLDAEDIGLGVSETTISASQKRLADNIAQLHEKRLVILADAGRGAVPAAEQSRLISLSQAHAQTLSDLEAAEEKRTAAEERLREIHRYRQDLADEFERMARAADAGEVLSDLRVTHCPACDQSIRSSHQSERCFVCHQALPDDPEIKGLGAVRLKFEQKRLLGELKEADELLNVLHRDVQKQIAEARTAKENLRRIDVELAPARNAVSALAQAEVSAVDIAIGQAAERAKQMDRVTAALELGKELTAKIKAIEDEIAPLSEKVNDAVRAVDFDEAAQWLEEGMNAYLDALNQLRPNTWKHSRIEVDLSKSSFKFRVGRKKWQGALGGTDSLYFLMSYHYGLLSLSSRRGTHYPGVSIIDVPGEFSGEAIEDKENFIVQPFIDLLHDEAYQHAQLIITGASFTGLIGAHVQKQTFIYLA
ncbi:hypothetical protein [Rhodovulum viride]|uniref:hypothetical protein n=1 Tax=Rhodovulum viride TaxID=1231134 RepID=UPI0011BF7ECF|nr:hypothetical protein [Rhodovulum viride]